MNFSKIFCRLFILRHKDKAETVVFGEELTTLQLRLNFLQEVFNNEQERKRNIENKASLIISSQTLITAVLSLLTIFFNQKEYSVEKVLLVVGGIILMILLIISFSYATRVLRRKAYSTVFVEDQEDVNSTKEYYEKMIEKYKQCIDYNKEIINGKCTNLVISQIFHSSFLFTLSLLVILLALDSLCCKTVCHGCIMVCFSIFFLLIDCAYIYYQIKS